MAKISTFYCLLQWLPQQWKYQLIYLAYRWIISIYFTGWFIASAIVGHRLHQSKYPIYITSWGFMTVVLYLNVAAFSITTKFVIEVFVRKTQVEELVLQDLQDPPLLACCCCCNDHEEAPTIPWYLQINWILMIVASEIVLPVVVIYWAIIFNGSVYSWPVNFHEHVLVLVPGIVDILVTRIPIRFFQFIYLMALAVVYGLFAGIYYAAGGTNTANKKYIYPLIDFENNLVPAIIVELLFILIIPILIHLMYWGLFLLRTLLLYVKIRHQSPHVTDNPHQDKSTTTLALTEVNVTT